MNLQVEKKSRKRKFVGQKNYFCDENKNEKIFKSENPKKLKDNEKRKTSTECDFLSIAHKELINANEQENEAAPTTNDGHNKSENDFMKENLEELYLKYCSDMSKRFPTKAIESAKEILQMIADLEVDDAGHASGHLSSFFSPAELRHFQDIGDHITEAVTYIDTPNALELRKGVSAADLIDIYVSSAMRLYYLMFKCEDYVAMYTRHDCLIPHTNILPSLIILSLNIYDPQTKCYAFPRANHQPPIMFHISDLMHLFPAKFVTTLIQINDVKSRFKLDWTMIWMMMCLFFYLPINGLEKESKTVRDKYISMLHRYILWKFGSQCARIMFPDILKWMDAVHLHSQELEHFQFSFNEVELYQISKRLSSLLAQKDPQKEPHKDPQKGPQEDIRHETVIEEVVQLESLSLSFLHNSIKKSIENTLKNPNSSLFEGQQNISNEDEILINDIIKLRKLFDKIISE